MKRKIGLYSAALIILLIGISVISVSVAYAHPGETLGTPDPWADPPTTPEPPGDGDTGNTTGDNNNKTTVLQIIKVVFDSSTMKDAIVTALNALFNEGLSQLTDPTSSFYQMGGEYAKFAFATDELKDIRHDTWIQLRKVAFALLPLVAALTIWASMKDGLYSVTGYANTFEAVTEFVVSIAIALASLWLMEQAISLVQTFSMAIASVLDIEISRSVFDGFMFKYSAASTKAPILTMIMSIFAFTFVLVYMGSVLLSFLAREVVIILTVALAPVMIILGTVRPLGWLRGLWSKAFLVYLLLLPVNVLTLGIGVKINNLAGSMSTGFLASLLQLMMVIGITSVIIAVNGTLGKMVYGAAIEVAEKIGSALTDVVAMGAMVVGAAATGGLGGAALAGTAGSLSPAAGGGSGAGLSSGGAALAGSTGGQVTSTSKLTSIIGGALSSSGNRVVRGFGNGMRVGSAVKDHKLATSTPPPSPKLDIANTEVPGIKEGKADVMSQIDTPQKANAIGLDQETLASRVDLGVNTAKATLVGAEIDDISGGDVLREANYLGRGNWDVKMGVREFVRSEAGSFAFQDNSMFKQKDIPTNTPATKDLHGRDFLAAQRIAQYDQRHTTDSPFHQISPDQIRNLSRAVRAQRLSGVNNYRDIVDDANRSASLSGWLRNIQGKS